jgi:hypothetical protein
VTASVEGPTGPSSWTQTVIVDPPLSASVTSSGGIVTAHSSGGAGALLAAHWTFNNGATAEGISVALPAGASGGSVTVVDATGNQLSLTF